MIIFLDTNPIKVIMKHLMEIMTDNFQLMKSLML